MTQPDTTSPYIGLIVSGGHTILCAAHGEGKFEVLGQTRDDAVGEAFDKVAKLLGLGYPGGPPIDRLSGQGQADRIAFPRSHSKQALDFSFSGLKTAVYQHLHQRQDHESAADVAASFQEAAIDMLLTRTLRACQRTGISRVIVGGGVAANSRLRSRLSEAAATKKLQVVFPPPELCSDNGAMVAGVAFGSLQHGKVAALNLTADPNLCLV
jgi:N6-L-threonylcarbamoyladenine synthase